MSDKKRGQLFEVQIKKGARKGKHDVRKLAGKVQIAPRTLGSLVQMLRSMYGGNYQMFQKTKKKRAKKRSKDEESETAGDVVVGLRKRILDENGAEALATKLYGDQSDIVDEFLQERRDCERELVFEAATFPLWVKLFWKVYILYELCSCCLLLTSLFYGSYAAFFRNHSGDVQFLANVTLIIQADIIIRLAVEFWRSKTHCQYEVFVVNYTFLLALVDLVATFPYSLTAILIYGKDIDNLDNLKAVTLMECTRVLHYFRVIKFLGKIQEEFNFGGHIQFIVACTRYLVKYIFVAHVLACIMFVLGDRSYIDWVLNRNPESGSSREFVTFLSIRSHITIPEEKFYASYPESNSLYLMSLYFVVSTISTVGIGDFYPVNTIERLVAILMMVMGSMWISGELAYNLSTFFTDLDATRYMMYFRVKCIKIHLQNYQVSNFICTRTESYYRHLWRYRKGVHEIDLTYLPHSVQEEIKFDICEEMFYKSPMFRGLDEAFLAGLAKNVKVSLYSPRMILFERGSITKQMCFILQGEVAVATGLDDAHISAIHRSGCLIGEINLFMAIPYQQTVYTRTVCTVMTVTKKDLMHTLQDYPHIFAIMRDRMIKRRAKYRSAFNLVEVHPFIQWMYPKSEEDVKSDPEFPVKVSHMKGLNRPITGISTEYDDEQVIIETPCARKDLLSSEMKAYRLVSVPQIYYDPGFLLIVVNTLLMGLWFYVTWLTPACSVFDSYDSNKTYYPACRVFSTYWPCITFVCAVDVVVELSTACPSTGIVFKLKDGLQVSKTSLGFYCDLLSLVPIELIWQHWYGPLLRVVLKFWKISRLWDFLDERFGLRLFYVRIAKLTYYLLYLTFLISLWLLSIACRPGVTVTQCNEISFFNPSHPLSRWHRVKQYQNYEQYILTTPIVLAASTITSVGFGNIYPQTRKEMIWITGFMIFGHFFVSYILAQLTSALSARLTPKLIFHQKLLAVEIFVRINGLSTKLLRKLTEHYDLQHQYVSGCSLPESTHLMYDGHKVLLDDVFLVEGEIFFDGVPAFTKIPSQAIIEISKLMQRFVVPPDLMFVQRGEVRRILYIIVNGSVALYQHGEASASAILTSTGHFGLRDLLFGEPYPYKVKTLSYVVLYAVDYDVFQEVLGDDEGLMDYIKDEMSRREDEIRTYLHSRIAEDTGRTRREVVPPSWIQYADDPDKPLVGGDLTYDHFEKPFLYYKGSNFIRERTMPFIVHPAGKFGVLWQAVMGLAAVANAMSLITETFIGYRTPEFRYLQFLLDLLFCADIYMKCHWAYYSRGDGEMRYHPLKTWKRYIFQGPFFIEVAMMIPLEFIMAMVGATNIFGYGPGNSWYTKLRWIRFLRSYKFIELYVIVHRIFEHRTPVLFIFYLSITLIMTTVLAAISIFFACPTFGYQWAEGDEYKLPVCERDTWMDQKAEDMLFLEKITKAIDPSTRGFMESEIFYPRTFIERLVIGLYYVGQVLMVIGFGDLATFRKNELAFLTSIALFGFIVSQAIISDVTSAQIDSDEIRSINREKLERLAIALSREEARASFITYVRHAFRLSWSYANGLQPNDLFTDLHPILHRELLSEYIGDVLDRVPIFLGFTDAFVNALKVKMKIEYYPKGGHVTSYGDLDYRMYVVVQGDIWVCDKADRWVCTISTGESIGEMSLVYGATRRFSAYAVTNLQLLVLDAVDFATALQNFPLTQKDVLVRLLNYRRESYLIKAKKWKARNLDEYTQTQQQNTEQLQFFMLKHLARIPVGGNIKLEEKNKCPEDPGFWKKIVGYGCSDIMIHYIYFASDNDKFNPVIHPACNFIINFKSLVQAVRFFAPLLSLYHVCFYSENIEDAAADKAVTRWTVFFSNAFDTILWVNMGLKFFTAIEINDRKTYCKNHKQIIVHYLFRVQGFWYDLLVAFPYDKVISQNTRWMMLRCLLAIGYYSELSILKSDIEVSTLKFKLLVSVSYLIYLAHMLACWFFTLACPNINNGVDNCTKSGWAYKFRVEFGKTAIDPRTNETIVEAIYEDHRPSHWYVVSVYWVMAVLSTCGFGDIAPTNFKEVSVATFIIFFGSLFLSIMLGNITSGLSSVNQAKRQFLGRVEKMLDYLQVIGLSAVGRETLGAYCRMTWNNCRGVNYNDIADILPLMTRQDVYLALYHHCVTHCLFFGKDYDIAFVRAICSRLRHYMFLPGMKIASELEQGTGIYIVMRGAVTSFQQNPETGAHEFIKRYEKHQVFGRIPALFPGAQYNKSYRAEQKSEVLLMYHGDIRQLLMKYPRWKIFLRQMIAREYDHFSKLTSLKNITERELKMDEKLTKNLTLEQFKEGAQMFAAPPPDRSGKVVKPVVVVPKKQEEEVKVEKPKKIKHEEESKENLGDPELLKAKEMELFLKSLRYGRPGGVTPKK